MNASQNAVNKLFRLHVPRLSSQYELMVGRTEPSVPGDSTQENYYKGMYFLACHQTNAFATFHFPVHYTRFVDKGIAGGIDCVAIASWLNSLPSIEALIADRGQQYTYDFPESEQKEYYDSTNDDE